MANPVLMTADDPSINSRPNNSTYGLFLNGYLILEPDSFISYSYLNDSRISQYPQEAGAFQNYNKVDTPFDLRIQVTKGGSTSDVSNFINTAESMAKASDLNLYELRSPERIYTSVNVSKVTHDHKPGHGANMVTMDISLVEIRETATAQYSSTVVPTTSGNLSSTATPAAADKIPVGTVQSAKPTPAQIAPVKSTLQLLADPSVYDPSAGG